MAHRAYVGNLPFTCTPEDLKTLFAPHGPVVHATIVLDRETGRSRGFGFVDFDSTATLLAAISAMDGQQFNGRPLVVNEAREKPPGGPGAAGRAPHRPGGPAAGASRAPGAGGSPGGGAPRGFGAPRTEGGARGGRKPWDAKKGGGDRWSDGGGRPKRRREQADEEDGY